MLLLAGCAPHTNPGVDVPVTFVWSLFSDTVNVYEMYNSGGWYDAGFLLGLSLIAGGSGRGMKRKS